MAASYQRTKNTLESHRQRGTDPDLFHLVIAHSGRFHHLPAQQPGYSYHRVGGPYFRTKRTSTAARSFWRTA